MARTKFRPYSSEKCHVLPTQRFTLEHGLQMSFHGEQSHQFARWGDVYQAEESFGIDGDVKWVEWRESKSVIVVLRYSEGVQLCLFPHVKRDKKKRERTGDTHRFHAVNLEIQTGMTSNVFHSGKKKTHT